MINPRNLRAFVMVARTGSVVRSATAIHRVQSAITRSIKELEGELGVQLFERRPYGMLLTESGKVLLLRAENIFAEMDTARAGLETTCGPLRLNTNAPIFSLGIGRQRLLVFVELMKQCHMGAVADIFGISQPAVSQALREVEQSIGIRLVARTPSGILPNDSGNLLATHLRRALAEMSKAEEEIVSLQQGITGHVAVGTLSLGRIRLLPQAIIHITQAHPKITVSTIEGSFEHLALLLRASEIDFMLGGLRPPEHMAGLTAQAVTSSHISLIARTGHPYSHLGHGEGWDLLSQASWILPQRGTWTRSSLEASFAAKQLPAPGVVVETADITITKGLLLSSDMITAASPHLFQHEIEMGELIVLNPSLPSQLRAIGIVQREGNKPTVAAQLLMDTIAEIQTTGPAQAPVRPQPSAQLP
ncbi:LysR family transcriptional regulator [Comamonas sp. BIGb0124]|uniref:LysR family transcriptional regulator n=1 Tax=Comamonas sp. BIGb0124 TaxID=2485130 RepID=UPI000F473452|nr:LysR family transcriptional regulator [Comamonas sp. BIGb0124]